ncbi:hypothetical protein EVAR_71708_1 [Eumeta japonica]|uniref:Uncharacterized protein n=1 Tax=Eumeta variegata TaxID=151549 RepID=A0A4C1T6Q8_EUMVA|nr:hypothetical protein EVAR_71708_1 [Eumeta japonica]
MMMPKFLQSDKSWCPAFSSVSSRSTQDFYGFVVRESRVGSSSPSFSLNSTVSKGFAHATLIPHYIEGPWYNPLSPEQW